MHSDWQAFLESRSAIPADSGTVRFPDAPVEAECALLDLSHLGLLSIAGADAMPFLQGQVSNDVRELSDTHSQLASHCNAKGRMIANFRLLRTADGALLVAPRALLGTLAQRLRMYVLRAKVRIDDISDALVCCGIVGACAEVPLGERLGELPTEDNGMVRRDGGYLTRAAGAPPRWLFVGPVAMAQALWLTLSDRAVPANADLWALHDIRAGIPTLLPATSELFVPQMANMHLIDGVSFHKGCYAGQEVVARMQYLGKLKRRMYRATLDAERAPRPGDALVACGAPDDRPPGRVVDARRNAAGRYELLAVAEIAAAEGGHLCLDAAAGPRLTLEPPAYGFAAA